eukprot:m.170352 g.170352  ORF g.170352 m.170352 type:complete len:147 (-) comp53251_c0_seq9:212-652(-)
MEKLWEILLPLMEGLMNKRATPQTVRASPKRMLIHFCQKHKVHIEIKPKHSETIGAFTACISAGPTQRDAVTGAQRSEIFVEQTSSSSYHHAVVRACKRTLAIPRLIELWQESISKKVCLSVCLSTHLFICQRKSLSLCVCLSVWW